MYATWLPVFRQDSPLAAVAQTWVNHYEHCSVCNKHDWCSPGLPQIFETEVLSSRKVTFSNGRTVWARDWSDPDVLCAVGRGLFMAWLRYIPRATFSGKERQAGNLKIVPRADRGIKVGGRMNS